MSVEEASGIGSDRQQIETLLDDFERKGLLDDARTAEAVVHARAARYGTRRLAMDLRARGIEDAVIDQALRHTPATELQRARELWRRRFGRLPADLTERARQQRFLMARGFSPDTIRSVLGGVGDDADVDTDTDTDVDANGR